MADDDVTKPLPDLTTTPTVDHVEVAPPKKKHRGRRIFAGVVIGLVILLAVVAVVGDAIARQVATAYARDQITKALNLPSSKPVHVNLGGGSILLQGLAGSINDVTVTVDKFSINGFDGSARVVAHGVPLDSNQPVRKLLLTVDATAASVQNAVKKNATELKDATVKLGKDRITVGASLTILGQDIPVTAGLKPGATDGDLSFTPIDFGIAGKTVNLTQLEALLPSGTLDGVAGVQTICIADKLPKSLVLKNVQVSAKQLEMRVNGDGAVLNADELKHKGSCD